MTVAYLSLNISGVMASPITSLNPALAAGWFAGYVQLKLAEPTAEDLQQFLKLDDLSSFWSNPAGKVLLVTALTNLGYAQAQASGAVAKALQSAGEGATTMVADAAGRVLVADTRGGELLVYGVDPLMLRQRFPVPDAPYGLVASGGDTPVLAWVAQTATNTVVGYDLSTGIPVEKVRYRTVQQPNSSIFTCENFLTSR